jgi:hypothetical protein
MLGAMRSPCTGPVLWHVARLHGEPIEVEPIVAQTWFEARAIAMARFGVEAHDVELVTRGEPASAKPVKRKKR